MESSDESSGVLERSEDAESINTDITRAFLGKRRFVAGSTRRTCIFVVLALASVAGESPDIIAGSRLDFVHIPKTGGSAIEKAAASNGVAWAACHFPFLKFAEWGCPSPPDFGLEARSTIGPFNPWHVPPRFWTRNLLLGKRLFTVVRNPYDRMVSAYYDPWEGYKGAERNDPVTMNAWIQEKIEKDNPLSSGIQFLPQWVYVVDERTGDGVVEVVLRQENLTDSFNAFMRREGLSIRLDSDRLNARTGDARLAVKDLSARTINAINKFAGGVRGFELLGYSMLLPKVSLR